jgi:hypothetical protein
VETAGDEHLIYLLGTSRQIAYRFADSTLSRRLGSGPWVQVLDRVKASSFEADGRRNVSLWRWELELQPQSKATIKASRIRPLFTFLAVSPVASAP